VFQVLKKVYGDGQGTFQYVTSVLNEWGQFLTTVVVASESENCYRRLARGLMARFKRANAPAPKVIYTDNSCCVAGGQGRLTSCMDPRQIQRLNQQVEVLFGKDHLFEPNFAAPMPYPDRCDDPDEEELLGAEYAQRQSTDFSPRD